MLAWLTFMRQSETVRLKYGFLWGKAMQIRTTTAGLIFAAILLPVASISVPMTATAQTAVSTVQMSEVSPTDVSAQSRRHRPARVRIYREDDRGVYPSYNPGPNAVRDCTATLVQEFRPSGTVIVPHMNCYWRRG
jgi:hypothetical protein